jgi:hypothetical protein
MHGGGPCLLGAQPAGERPEGSRNYIHLHHGNPALLTMSLEVIQKTSASSCPP